MPPKAPSYGFTPQAPLLQTPAPRPSRAHLTEPQPGSAGTSCPGTHAADRQGTRTTLPWGPLSTRRRPAPTAPARPVSALSAPLGHCVDCPACHPQAGGSGHPATFVRQPSDQAFPLTPTVSCRPRTAGLDPHPHRGDGPASSQRWESWPSCPVAGGGGRPRRHTTFDVRGVNTSAGLTSAPVGEGDQFSFSPCRSLTHPGKGLILSDPLPASSRPQPKAPAHPVGAGIHIFHQAGQGVRPAGRPRASSCAQLGATSGLLGLEAWLGDGGPACSLLPGHSPRRPAGALPVGACAVSTAGV